MTDLYPDIPGFKAGSPETARLAAESMAHTARTIEAQALAAVRRAGACGLTSDEIAERIGLRNHYAARPASQERNCGQRSPPQERLGPRGGGVGTSLLCPNFGG